MRTDQSHKYRILIVDDEPTLVFFLRQGLIEAGLECEVEVAGSGEEALAKLTYDHYMVLITDLKMPGISGLTLAEAARSIHPKIGIILMTAFGSREVELEVKKLKVDGYLTKPFPISSLCEMIKTLLAEVEPDGSGQLPQPGSRTEQGFSYS